MTTSRVPLIAVIAALTVTAAACSSGSGAAQHGAASGSGAVAATAGPGGVQQVTIDATNSFRFSPPTVTAHTGVLQITLVDTGSYPHNLSVDALHVTSKTVTGDLGRQNTTFSLTFAHPGTYTFVCTYHSSAGMRGTFVIN